MTPLKHGKGLVSGGRNINGFRRPAELYDPVSGTFGAHTAAWTTGRSLTQPPCMSNGMVWLRGGKATMTILLGDRSTQNFKHPHGNFLQPPVTGPPRASCHTAVLLNNGMVSSAGGFDGQLQQSSPAETDQPATMTQLGCISIRVFFFFVFFLFCFL